MSATFFAVRGRVFVMRWGFVRVANPRQSAAYKVLRAIARDAESIALARENLTKVGCAGMRISTGRKGDIGRGVIPPLSERITVWDVAVFERSLAVQAHAEVLYGLRSSEADILFRRADGAAPVDIVAGLFADAEQDGPEGFCLRLKVRDPLLVRLWHRLSFRRGRTKARVGEALQ